MFILKDEKSKSSQNFDNFFCFCFQRSFKLIVPDTPLFSEAKNVKKEILMMLYDLSSAFDTVSHQILISKL